MKKTRLEEWVVCRLSSKSQGKFLMGLEGIVTNHPRIDDGSYVYTTPIIKAEKRTITTRSCVVYVLGKISVPYHKFIIKERKIKLNPAQPVILGEVSPDEEGIWISPIGVN